MSKNILANFYIIASPIGNLADISFRAIEVLKKVDLILCEDTRVTKKLLNNYQIKNETLSFHAQSKLTKTEKIFSYLKQGKNLALISDAGTPTISDPGSLLINQIREKFKDSVTIIPIPGACALITALSASGFPANHFTFLGFLPHKKGRETLFQKIASSQETIVFYESPHRILKTLFSLNKTCPNKKICLARELTKVYEEFKFGSASELLIYLTENPIKQKGEFTVLINN